MKGMPPSSEFSKKFQAYYGTLATQGIMARHTIGFNNAVELRWKVKEKPPRGKSTWMIRDINLQGADLSGLNLCNAILTNVNLRFADLRKTKLDGADLSGADLSGALIDAEQLANVKVQPLHGPAGTRSARQLRRLGAPRMRQG